MTRKVAIIQLSPFMVFSLPPAISVFIVGRRWGWGGHLKLGARTHGWLGNGRVRSVLQSAEALRAFGADGVRKQCFFVKVKLC